MRLSQKTKGLMELVFMTGLDAFTNSNRLQSCLSSYGDWEHPSSYLRQMRSMQEKGLLKSEEQTQTEWIPKLTANGIDAIAELVDPERFWNQNWDQNWRTVTFDIPASERKQRQRLDSWLQKERFGHLQGSLWLSARPYRDWNQEIVSLNIDPRAVIFIEGKPLGNLSNENIVKHAWQFDKINAQYEEYLQFLASPISAIEENSSAFIDWFRKESHLWRKALDIDPLLPRQLHPPSYLGQKSWAARKQAFSSWKAHLLA